MASKWIKCTSNDGKTAIHVNLANARTIVAHKKGTRIVFAGGETDYVDVKEVPEDILELLFEAKQADRL